MKSELRTINGNKDLIELLEETLEEAKSGKLEAILIVGCNKGDGITTGGNGWQCAYNEDMLFPWARIVAALAAAQTDLIRDGLNT